MSDDMGTFRVDIEIENPARPGERRIVPSALVDTGAELTWVPAPVLETLGIERLKAWHFRQADGTILERWVGSARVYAGGTVATTTSCSVCRATWCSSAHGPWKGSTSRWSRGRSDLSMPARLRPPARLDVPRSTVPDENLLMADVAMTPSLAVRPLACFLLCSSPRRSPRSRRSQATWPSRIDHIFARSTRTTPGCGVGLAKDGRPLYMHGYGSANLEYGVPNTDSTVFESGSVAKQFTAAALVLLAQDGKLSLDDDIRKYLPEVPTFGGQKITIRNLLTHTSGLRDQWGLLGIEGRGPGTQVHSPLTTLDLIAHQKMLNFPPGSEYLYSNSGYALAGLIVQRVSGKTLDAFTQERLFTPLGMTHTQWRDDFTEVVPNRATAYAGSAASRLSHRHAVHEHDRQRRPAQHDERPAQVEREPRQSEGRRTGRTSTRWRRGCVSRAAARSPTRSDSSVDDYHGVREVSHSGSTAGYRTFLARYPDQHVSVAVWCNYAGRQSHALAHQVADLVLAKPQRARRRPERRACPFAGRRAARSGRASTATGSPIRR